MSTQRRISWNTALRDIHSDRTRVAPGIALARCLIQGLSRIRRTCLVTLTGEFDRAAIMMAAVEAAKAHQIRTGETWPVSMSVGLTAAWQAAKAARRAAMPRAQASIENNREASRCGSLQSWRTGGQESASAHGDETTLASPTRRSRILFAKEFPGAAGNSLPTIR